VTQQPHLDPSPFFLQGGPPFRHDPEAKSRIWSYNDWPTAGVHELRRLTREVKRHLLKVRAPLLIIYSTDDQTIHPDSGPYAYERAGSADKELVTLHGSGHVLTVDAEWELVAEKTYQFIQDHLPGQGDEITGP